MARAMVHLGVSIVFLLMIVATVSSQETLYPPPPTPYLSQRPPPVDEIPSPPPPPFDEVLPPPPPPSDEVPSPPPSLDEVLPAPPPSDEVISPPPTPPTHTYYPSLSPPPEEVPSPPPSYRYMSPPPTDFDPNAYNRVAVCMDKSYADCYMTRHVCYGLCPYPYCEVDCSTCSPVCNFYLSQAPPNSYLSQAPLPVDEIPSPPPPDVPSPPPPSDEVLSPPPTPPTHTYYPSLSPPPEEVPSPPPLAPPPLSSPTDGPPPPSDPESPPRDRENDGPYNRAPPGSPPDIYNPPSLFPDPSTQAPPWYLTPPSNQHFSPPATDFDPNTYDPGVAYCTDKKYGYCYMTRHVCHGYCPDRYCEVDCSKCSPVCTCNRPGGVCADPQFVGADGLTFYFHGKKDKDFCIVSDANLHINAHFIGKRNPKMKRDFTWVQSLGIMFNDQQLYIAAEKTSTWYDSVDRLVLKFNGQSIYLPTKRGAKWQPINAPNISVTRSRDTNVVLIEVEGNFQLKAAAVPITDKDSKVHNYGITGDDCFAHLDLSFKFYSLGADVNGVLGQTYASNYESKVKLGVVMSVLGGKKEFASSNLFSTDCAASRFNGGLNSSKKLGYGSLSCASGMDGKGVVCKR